MGGGGFLRGRLFPVLGGDGFLEGGRSFPVLEDRGFLGRGASFPVSGGGFLQELEESGGVPGR